MLRQSYKLFISFITKCKGELLLSLLGGIILTIIYLYNQNPHIKKSYWYSDGWMCETRTQDNTLSNCRQYDGAIGEYTVDIIYNATNIRVRKQ